MLASSALYQLALRQSHRRETYVRVRTPDGAVLADNVRVQDGNVTASLTGRVTRSATFATGPEWFPVGDGDPFSPFHAIAEIRSGIGYPDGSAELFPVFTGRIYSASLDENGQVTFRADDLAADVVVSAFETPENSQLGSSTLAEIRRLVTDAYQWAEFGTDDAADSSVPKLTWDSDRGKALDDLAATLAARWFTTGDGRFVTRRYAYTDTTPVAVLTDGAGGTLTSARISVTADGTYNSVVVTSERADGGDPVTVTERNLSAAGAARYGGPFGKRVLRVTSQTSGTAADTQRVARGQLAASSALISQWDITCVPDMSLEPGDVASLSWRGIKGTQVVDSITYPLDAQTAMTVSARSVIDTTT